jgi:hypothetical protein
MPFTVSRAAPPGPATAEPNGPANRSSVMVTCVLLDMEADQLHKPSDTPPEQRSGQLPPRATGLHHVRDCRQDSPVVSPALPTALRPFRSNRNQRLRNRPQVLRRPGLDHVLDNIRHK